MQALRAVAIIGVLSFHFAPKTFVNGWLGVDTFVELPLLFSSSFSFFVLSGYLMATILSREEKLTL